MILKRENAKSREFKGVSFDVLSIGKQTMLTKMNYRKGDHVPFHKHSNEQSGYVISGKVQIKFLNNDELLKPGDSYSIAEDVEHSLDAIENSEIIDVFVPPREDYL